MVKKWQGHELYHSKAEWVAASNYDALEARLAEAEAALKAVMSAADAAKEPCGMDPESPAAIRNGVFANIAQLAAQGLGLVRGPRLADSADAVQQEDR